jgi:hypothetical protein
LQPLLRWAIVCTSDDAYEDPQYGSWINHFITEIRKSACGDKNVNKPDIYQIMNGRWRTKDEVIKEVQKVVKSRQIWSSYQIVLFVLPQRAEPIYKAIKQATNNEIKVPTQCVVSNNIQGTYGPKLLGLWLQMQTKLFFFFFFFFL